MLMTGLVRTATKTCFRSFFFYLHVINSIAVIERQSWLVDTSRLHTLTVRVKLCDDVSSGNDVWSDVMPCRCVRCSLSMFVFQTVITINACQSFCHCNYLRANGIRCARTQE